MDPAMAAAGSRTAQRDDARAGQRRVQVERVQPEIDGGRFPIKRAIGETVVVTADVLADGHDLLAGVLKYRHAPPHPPAAGPDQKDDAPLNAAGRPSAGPALHTEGPAWIEIPLTPLGNDAWTASFVVTELGEYEYTVEAWIDRFGSWLKGLLAKADAQQDVASELLEGAEIVQQAVGSIAGHARTDEDVRLIECADLLRGPLAQSARVAAARDASLHALMAARPDRTTSTTYSRALRVVSDPVRARYGAWYEMFPRSCTTDAARSGTFREAEARLPAIAEMGFDVLYLPPVHPIGHTHRKGRNNALTAAADDPGSPWAIGSAAGGHTAVEPGLGTIEDFDRFVAVASQLGLEVALDIAFQVSPDHPWVREHPEWFKHRPDGSIKYAENPPKKYQDIYPFDFESEDWPALWTALRDVVLFWIAHGVKIFRVDNPHRKPFVFWEWLIASVRREHPEAIFLSEAFTRPKVMRYLAKAGFTQSYTYFTWRNTAQELREYLTELTRTELQEYMRPNFFANTPDILHEYLQTGGRPAFQVRLILAATLAASYGIYSGFELCENVPVRHGSEEYLHSEKYEIRPRDWNQPGRLNELIGRVNQIRRDHVALQTNATLAFHATDNPAFLWFSKRVPGPRSGGRPAYEGRVFVIVNTDPHWMQHGWVQMPLDELGLAPDHPYIVEDLLEDVQYTWYGEWNYVRLDPGTRVAHVLVVRG